jgi:hypothetical protein
MYGIPIKIREIAEETIFDKIGKYHVAGSIETMPDDLKAIYERWNEVFECFDNGRKLQYKGKEIDVPYKVRELAQHLKEKFQISLSQAYEDINNAKYFHMLAEPREHKEFARGWVADQIKRDMALLESQGKIKEKAAFYKQLIIVLGLDKTDLEAPNYKDIEIPEMIIVDDPREAIPNLPEVKNPRKISQKYLKQRKEQWIEGLVTDAEEINDAE